MSETIAEQVKKRYESIRDARMEKFKERLAKLKRKARKRLDRRHQKTIKRLLRRLSSTDEAVYASRRAVAVRMKEMGFVVSPAVNRLGRTGWGIAHPEYNIKAHKGSCTWKRSLLPSFIHWNGSALKGTCGYYYLLSRQDGDEGLPSVCPKCRQPVLHVAATEEVDAA